MVVLDASRALPYPALMAADTTTMRDLGPVNWMGVRTLLRKEIGRFMRVWPQTLMAPIISNILYMTVFVVVFAERRGNSGGSAEEFAAFLAPGLVMLGVLNNASANSSSSIMGSKMMGSIVDVLMPPLSYAELAAGYIGGAIVRGVLVAVATAAVLSVFTPLWPVHWWAVLYFGLAAATIMAMVGVLSGIWAEKFDQLAVVNQFVILPMSFLSGTFYSIYSLPETWRTVSLLNPLFYLIDGFRYGFTGEHESNLGLGIAYSGALLAVLFTACMLVLRSGWKLKA